MKGILSLLGQSVNKALSKDSEKKGERCQKSLKEHRYKNKEPKRIYYLVHLSV